MYLNRNSRSRAKNLSNKSESQVRSQKNISVKSDYKSHELLKSPSIESLQSN